MSALERLCLPIAALGLGLGLSCSSGDSYSQCKSAGDINCKITVSAQRICKTLDWDLKIQFTDINLITLDSINMTLTQPDMEPLPVVLRKDTMPGSYKTTVKQDVLSKLQRGSAILRVKDEPAFDDFTVNVISTFSLTKTTKDYVDPGMVKDGTPTPGSFPWPERVGVRPDGSIIVMNKGVENVTEAVGWKVLSLRYDKMNELLVAPSFPFNGTLSANTTPLSVDVNSSNLIVTNGLATTTAASVLSCKEMEKTLVDCTNLCNTMMAGTDFTSLMHRNYKSVFVHPQDPYIAYIDSLNNLLTAKLPVPATADRIKWAKAVALTPGSTTPEVLLGMGKLDSTAQSSPNLLAVAQDASAMTMTLSTYQFDSSGTGALGPETMASKTLSQPQLLDNKPIQALAIGDLDGDGLDDIVYVRDHKIQVLNNLGNGSYCPDVLADDPGEITAITIGDINGDARKDVVLIRRLAKTVSAYLNSKL